MQVCALSPLSGLCLPAIAITNGMSEYSGVHSAAPTLLSNSTDYCEDSDVECSVCLAQSRSSGAVCTGSAGCVCVGVCDNDPEAWNATATQLLARILDGKQPSSLNETDGRCQLPIDDSLLLPSPSPPAKSSSSSENECMWHPSENGEYPRPRSCYECLNEALPSGQVSLVLSCFCVEVETDLRQGVHDHTTGLLHGHRGVRVPTRLSTQWHSERVALLSVSQCNVL